MGKRKTDSKKKSFFKRWWIWGIVIIILAAGYGNTGENEKELKENGMSEDKFVEEVKSAAQGGISSADESIEDVVLKDENLCVYVDLGDSEPSPLTMEDLAWTRTSAITDAILTLDDYDQLWNTITIDFGNIGYITNHKDDIESNEAGRYFPSSNFKLEYSQQLHSETETMDDTPKSIVENIIRDRITSEYLSTDIDSITINENLGTEEAGDYIALVYLTWNVSNSPKLSKDMLNMYSSDLAATVANECENVAEIAVFWTVPYLNDANAKCSYERINGGMYEMDMVWGAEFE